MPDKADKQILVSGAGIGGLCAAIALSGQGLSIRIFEQVEKLEAIGAGIQLSPNAWATLEEMGVIEALEPFATFPQHIKLHNQAGRLVSALPLGEECRARFGAPYGVIHRGDLQSVLKNHLSSKYGIEVETGMPVHGASQDDTGITLKSSDPEPIKGALLIAADGVHSSIRNNALGLQPATDTGKTAWRAMIDARDIDDPHLFGSTSVWLAPGHHAVTYSVSAGRFLNLILITPNPVEKNPDQPELSVFPADAPQSALFRKATGWGAWPLLETPQPFRMAKGRIALLGDAAHAMLPFAAQGAAMAIEDAAVLAKCIASLGPGQAALERYAEKRLARTSRVAEFARRNGAIYHMPRPFSVFRNIGMRVLPADALLDRQAWIYGWRP